MTNSDVGRISLQNELDDAPHCDFCGVAEFADVIAWVEFQDGSTAWACGGCQEWLYENGRGVVVTPVQR